ncbi:MAG: hypothetical protein RBT33_00510 [Candidatus Dojkabacteria bacterium]|jgi:hypothetical protein|nr:hypothetical protein [Candidatus Dojkabacteria bacterium]
MAKKSKTENFDALGSVFDFLFTEAKKPPDKRKPIKPTGVAGDSALTDALFSSLEMPGAFVTDTIVDEFNGAIDIELGRVKYGEYGNVKFTTTSLIDLLKDPEKAFQKAVTTQKAIRKSQRAMFLGAAMEDLVTSAWAHKYGNLEARAAIYGASVANRAESYKIERALGQFGASHKEDGVSKLQGTGAPGRFSPKDLNFMADRSTDLLGSKTFGSNWNTLSDSDKAEFASQVSGKKTSEIQTYLAKKYGTTIPSAATNFGAAVGSTENVDIFNGALYKKLEGANLQDKIADPSTSSEEREIYKKTYYLLQRDKVTLNTAIKDIKDRLKRATSSVDKAVLEKELKETRNVLRIVQGHGVFGRIGQIEGYYNSLNNIYGGVLGSNFAASVLNGKLYDKNQNSLFLPVSEAKVGGVDILVAKDSPYKLLGKYNQVMTDIYYLTPRSLARNFYNGEGFAYLLHKKLINITKLPAFSKLSSLGIDKKTLLEGFNSKDIDTFINDLLKKSSGILNAKELEKLEKFLQSSKTLKKLAHRFSFVSRVQESLNKALGEQLKKFRTEIKDWILKNPKVLAWFTKVGADKLLKQWALKGGIDVLIKSLLSAIASALGLSMGPVVSAIVGGLTMIVSGVVMKVLGVGLNMLKWAAIGAFAILLIIPTLGYGSLISYNQKNLSYKLETPGSIIQCTVYQETELEEGDTPWGDTIIPPPSGESCIFGAGSFGCSQGYNDVDGWTHQRTSHLMPVDLTSVGYIYAPQFCSTGNCSITRIAMINCSDGSNAGGIVELTATSGGTTYFFKLLHVKPLAGLGEKLSGGQAVAVVQESPEVEKGWCWTGKHLHLETRQNGAVVDPLELLQSFSCGVPDESSCSRPKPKL